MIWSVGDFSCSFACNGSTVFLFTSFACSKESTFALSSLAPNSNLEFSYQDTPKIKEIPVVSLLFLERRGFEPLTPTLPVSCATNCANAPCVYFIFNLLTFRVERSPPSNLILNQICGSLPTPHAYCTLVFYILTQKLLKAVTNYAPFIFSCKIML